MERTMNTPTTLHYAIGTSTLSQVLVAAASDRGICALLLGDQADALRTRRGVSQCGTDA
jgi:AraC family transcriptional regulator of adaptative response/methylated-DNA-[protein]-cysteine methyltransferase